jgi:dGTPase
VPDLIDTSRERIAAAQPKNLDDVRNAPPLIAFSEPMAQQARLLKRFLMENLYRHYQVNRMTSKARRIVTDLFETLLAQPTLLPPEYQVRSSGDGGATRILQARQVADYIAGMTDRYAIREHRRLFLIDEL